MSTQNDIVMLPAHVLDGWEYGYGDWLRRDRASSEQQKEWAATQEPKLAVPVEVKVTNDGTVLFNNGHHRVRAGQILERPIPCIIARNDLSPDVWSAYLDRLQRGYTKRQINPESWNLNRRGVPSVEALEAGKASGLRDYELEHLYQEFDKRATSTQNDITIEAAIQHPPREMVKYLSKMVLPRVKAFKANAGALLQYLEALPDDVSYDLKRKAGIDTRDLQYTVNARLERVIDGFVNSLEMSLNNTNNENWHYGIKSAHEHWIHYFEEELPRLTETVRGFDLARAQEIIKEWNEYCAHYPNDPELKTVVDPSQDLNAFQQSTQALAETVTDFKSKIGAYLENRHDRNPPKHEDEEVLYHTTTRAREIVAHGFQLEMPENGGIGGSQTIQDKETREWLKGISFTSDLYVAKNIAKSLKEVIGIANGTYKWHDVVRWAAEDGITHKDLMQSYDSFRGSRRLEKNVRDRLQTENVKKYKEQGGEYQWVPEYAKPNRDTPKEVFALYRGYISVAGWNGKRYDPVFFSMSIDQFKGLDESDVGIVKARCNMKDPAVMYLHSMSEWRVPPRAVVKIEGLISDRSAQVIVEHAYEITSMPPVYHAGTKRIKKVDESKLGDRDSGYYGEGFYVSTDPEYVREWYGPVVSAFTVSQDAKCLRACTSVEDADSELWEAVAANERALLEARDNAARLETVLAELRSNDVEWVHAVDRFAEEQDYDVVYFNDHEIVVKTPSVLEASDITVNAAKSKYHYKDRAQFDAYGNIEGTWAPRVQWPLRRPRKKTSESGGAITVTAMALIHDNPDNPMMVWRIENAQGKGPYSSGFPVSSITIETPPSLDHYLRTPSPGIDFSYQEQDSAGIAGRPYGTAQAKFGFESRESAAKWFGDLRKALPAFEAAGYSLKQVPASKVWKSQSGRQLMYLPVGATAQETVQRRKQVYLDEDSHTASILIRADNDILVTAARVGVDALKAKYPHIFPEHIDIIAANDPSHGKYTAWMVKVLEPAFERVSNATYMINGLAKEAGGFIQQFMDVQRFLGKGSLADYPADINQYKDIAGLRVAIQAAEPMLWSKQTKDFKVVFEDDDWIVYEPNTKAALVTLADNLEPGTKTSYWCVARRNQTHYEDYKKKDGDARFILIKSKIEPRVQFLSYVVVEENKEDSYTQYILNELKNYEDDKPSTSDVPWQIFDALGIEYDQNDEELVEDGGEDGEDSSVSIYFVQDENGQTLFASENTNALETQIAQSDNLVLRGSGYNILQGRVDNDAWNRWEQGDHANFYPETDGHEETVAPETNPRCVIGPSPITRSEDRYHTIGTPGIESICAKAFHVTETRHEAFEWLAEHPEMENQNYVVLSLSVRVHELALPPSKWHITDDEGQLLDNENERVEEVHVAGTDYTQDTVTIYFSTEPDPSRDVNKYDGRSLSRPEVAYPDIQTKIIAAAPNTNRTFEDPLSTLYDANPLGRAVDIYKAEVTERSWNRHKTIENGKGLSKLQFVGPVKLIKKNGPVMLPYFYLLVDGHPTQREAANLGNTFIRGSIEDAFLEAGKAQQEAQIIYAEIPKEFNSARGPNQYQLDNAQNVKILRKTKKAPQPHPKEWLFTQRSDLVQETQITRESLTDAPVGTWLHSNGFWYAKHEDGWRDQAGTEKYGWYDITMGEENVSGRFFFPSTEKTGAAIHYETNTDNMGDITLSNVHEGDHVRFEEDIDQHMIRSGDPGVVMQINTGEPSLLIAVKTLKDDVISLKVKPSQISLLLNPEDERVGGMYADTARADMNLMGKDAQAFLAGVRVLI